MWTLFCSWTNGKNQPGFKISKVIAGIQEVPHFEHDIDFLILPNSISYFMPKPKRNYCYVTAMLLLCLHYSKNIFKINTNTSIRWTCQS